MHETFSNEFEAEISRIVNSSQTTEELTIIAGDLLNPHLTRPCFFSNIHSYIQLDKYVNPCDVLAAMMQFAPSEAGMRWVAAGIVACEGNSDAMIIFSDIFLRYVLLVFKGDTDILESWHPTTRTADDVVREGLYERLLQRDSFRCVVSGAYLHDHGPPTSMKRHLEPTHIIKRAVAIAHSSQKRIFPSTLSIIQCYLGLTLQLTTRLMTLIDEPQNGLLLEQHYHYMFEHFAWALKPTCNEDTYQIEIVTPRHFTPSEYIALSQTIVKFTSPAPQPEFIALHRSVAHVLEKTGAGVAIDKTFDRAWRVGKKGLAGRMGEEEIMNVGKGSMESGQYKESGEQTALQEGTM